MLSCFYILDNRSIMKNNMISLFRGFLIFLGTLGVLLFGMRFAFCADASVPATNSEPQQMQDFNLAGYGPEGQKTWEVEGATMDMVGNDVKMSDITAHLYGESENMTLTADNGRMNKQTGVMRLEDNVRAVTDSGAQLDTNYLDWSQKDQLITTNDRVNITKDHMTAQGQGIEVQPDLKIAKFEKDVVMTMNGQKNVSPEEASPEKAKGGSEEKKTEIGGFGKGRLVITCDGPMNLEYEKHFATFEDNVKVDDEGGGGTLYADKMTVYFSEVSKQIEKIDAQGHVRIVRGESTSYSEGAIFTIADKKVILTGRPKLVVFTDSEEGEEGEEEGEDASLLKDMDKEADVPAKPEAAEVKKGGIFVSP